MFNVTKQLYLACASLHIMLCLFTALFQLMKAEKYIWSWPYLCSSNLRGNLQLYAKYIPINYGPMMDDRAQTVATVVFISWNFMAAFVSR